MLRVPLIGVLLFAAWLAGCRREQHGAAPTAGTVSRQAVIHEIQEFGKSFGFEETGSFAQPSSTRKAYYRCYYTDKLRLPDSYQGLKVVEGSERGCNVDERKYDVFFYRIEAVASRKTRTTTALAEASLERLAVVVSHEDFHQQKAIRRLPDSLGEAASTLVGFLTAAEYAKKSLGTGSDLYQNLSGEASLFLKKAQIVNQFHARLGRVYKQVSQGEMTVAAARVEKVRIFQELAQSCLASTPDPSSFNECPAALNNAGLAFDHTYAKHYPLLYRFAAQHNGNVRDVVKALLELPEGRWSEAKAVDYFERSVAGHREPAALPAR